MCGTLYCYSEYCTAQVRASMPVLLCCTNHGPTISQPSASASRIHGCAYAHLWLHYNKMPKCQCRSCRVQQGCVADRTAISV